jgi:drug/metabolite transporter (DMT)-like permease
MSAQEHAASAAGADSPGARWGDLGAIAVCALAWGTTFYAITLQLGVVDPVISIVYRFSLAAALLFAWAKLRGERLALTWAQHAAAIGTGFFTFSVNYTLVYWAEARVTSAVVAVLFAAMAFVNLITFRLAFGQRAPALAWGAAALGVCGVAILSWQEIAGAEFGGRASVGIMLASIAVIGGAIGNLFARRGEMAGAGVTSVTAWAMAYGAGILAMYALVTGKAWIFEWTWSYALSLLHLAVFGSVVAFALYYGLARRRGYTTASYISAITPPLAMLVSSLFEAKTWGAGALVGIVLVLAGQVLLLRVKGKS